MRKKTGKEGFIAIIALGIFALMMLFGIMVQTTVVNTFASVKDTNNYYQAKDIADSLIRYMQLELKSHDAGYNTGKINCKFIAGVAAPNNSQACGLGFLREMAGTHNVDITYEIKGRPEPAEKVNTTKCHSGVANQNFNGSCYVTPLGDGDAGSRCNVYEPGILNNPDPDGNASQTVDAGIAGVAGIDNLDYSCNWNKLTFGSSLTDRVAIPLYYDGSGPGQQPAISNLFYNEQPANIKLLLRLRTPCLPCAENLEPGEIAPPGFRRCDPGADETVCRKVDGTDDRYVLDQAINDIVVQWQLGGRCTPVQDGREEECGAVSFPDKPNVPLFISAIYESMINRDNKNKTVIVNATSKAQATYVHVQPPLQPFVSTLLQKFTKPVLTLFLSKSLISDQGFNVPYLEYQVLTNKPIGNSKTKVNVINVNVDGSNFSESLYQEQSKPLIDFAIQN